MIIRKAALALALFAAASCHSAGPDDPGKPGSYAVNLALEPAAGAAPLQRLALPAPVLVAVKRPDLGDIRVFDSTGRQVALALAGNSAERALNSASVPVYPVVGPAATLGESALSIRIENNAIARVVTVESAAGPATTASPTASLLDTHDLREPVHAIALDADFPADRPVTLALYSSANLSDWQPLAEKVLFRPAHGPALLGGARIELAGVDLHGRYVGIVWRGAKGVALNGARAFTAVTAPPARIAVGTTGAALADAHVLRFDLPAMARLAALRLTETGPDGVVPVRLFGRNHAEEPWTDLAATTLRPGASGATLDLPGPPLASYRLVADRRTAGFTTAPKLELLFDPVELLVTFSGTPPYRLAAGQATARASYLTPGEIAPQITPAALAALPQARLSAPTGSPPLVTLQPGAADGELEPRKLALWAALLLGTLVLAFAAIRLLRKTGVEGE